LLDHLGRQGARPELLAKAGLAVPRREGSGHYDRFRGRVMIPIRNESGKVVGFGGRVLGAGEPKYLNSPETPIYSKSRLLFGFDLARDGFRREGFAILVEGYLDAIAAHQAGFTTAVACCGTALTRDHGRLLRRYTEEIVVGFDPDSAGAAATRRSIDLLLEEGFRISVLELPAGEDPDSLIRKQGAAAFRSRLSARSPFVDYLMKTAAARHDVRSPRGKAAFLEELVPTLARIGNDVERASYVDPLARHAGIENQLVIEHLRREVQQRKRRVELPPETDERVTDAERDLLLWAVSKPADTLRVLGEIEDADLAGLATARILKAIKELAQAGELSTDRVLGRLSHPGDHRLFTAIAARPDPVSARQTPRDCLNSLRRQRIKRELAELQAQIERAADDSEFARISAAKLELRRQMEKLA
jgi:DNA primase